MPILDTKRSASASNFYKSVSYETLTASWFTHYDVEVFLPIIDHGMKTDLLVSNGTDFYRIQVKTVETNDESHVVDNMWGDADIDYVVYFSRTGNWGYIAKPFKGKRKPLNAPEHIRFHQHHKPFIKAFEKI